MRWDPNGLPLSPAVMTKERENGAPLPGLGCRQGERFRFDAAGFLQSHQEMPMLVDNGCLDLFVVIARVRQDDHLTRIV